MLISDSGDKFLPSHLGFLLKTVCNKMVAWKGNTKSFSNLLFSQGNGYALQEVTPQKPLLIRKCTHLWPVPRSHSPSQLERIPNREVVSHSGKIISCFCFSAFSSQGVSILFKTDQVPVLKCLNIDGMIGIRTIPHSDFKIIVYGWYSDVHCCQENNSENLLKHIRL